MATTIYTLTCLSPVHIGTGTQFSKFDSVFESGRWYLIDLDKVLARGVDANGLARAMSDRNFTWRVWLSDKGIGASDVAAYALPCPQDPGETPLREAMKDVYGKPYVPGTSVKGAIRTAVLWRLMKDEARMDMALRCLKLVEQVGRVLRALDDLTKGNDRRSLDTGLHRQALQTALDLAADQVDAYQRALYLAVGRDPDLVLSRSRERQQRVGARVIARLRRSANDTRYADDAVERALIGYDPNHDLMRVVQVSDSGPEGIERLAVGLVWTYTLRGNRLVEKREQDGEYKVLAEWLAPDTTLQLDLRTDDFLFMDAANRDLHFRGAKEQVVRELARTCNDYARAVIAREKAFYEEHGLNVLQDFYSELETTLNGVPDGAFLLNIGWGSGWEVKTVGGLLQAALGADGFKQLRQRYRLGEDPRTHQIYPNVPFPHTRRIAYEGGAPTWSMGWVKWVPARSEQR